MDEEESDFCPVLTSNSDDPVVTVEPVHSITVPLNIAHSQEHHRSQNQLGTQLGRLKQETSRYRQPPHFTWKHGCAQLG